MKPKRFCPPQIAISERVERLLADCGIHTPPVNLYRIAKQQRICRIRELDTQLDGQLLELDTGEYEVVLSRNAPSSRKRFTLAHEIAHVLLASEKGAEGLVCGEGSLEDLCNAIASEILMPRKFLQKTVTTDVTVETLLEVAKLFGCSLEAAGRKLLNEGFVRGAFLIWSCKKLGDEQVLELMAGPQTFGFKMPFKRGKVLYPNDSLWQACTGEESGQVNFATRPELRGEFIRLNRTVLMLFSVAGNGHSTGIFSTAGPRQGRLGF